MKILGEIALIEPLALVVSLPDQLFAHVPITQVSSQLTNLLESMDDDENSDMSDDDDDDSAVEHSSNTPPELADIFRVGQYVRAVVTKVHSPGSTDALILGKSRDEVVRASRRVELSLDPAQVNAGVEKADLKTRFVSAPFLNRPNGHMTYFELHAHRPFRLLSRALKITAISSN